MYTLYYAPGTCSMAIHALLNEINAEFKLERVDLQAQRNPEFLKLNPRGQVPVLVDGDLVLREGAAIAIYLLEKHASNLLPAKGKERAKALQWLMFANSSLHPAYSRVFFLVRNTKDEALTKTAIDVISTMYKELEEHLATSRYLAGEQVTAADILLAVFANWGRGRFPTMPVIGPNVKRLIKEISARPAFAKAIASEQVDYQAAA